MTYRVYGRIRRSDNGQGIPNLTVKAYDVDWISSNDYLGSDVTDADGNYEIQFTRDDFDAGWFDIEGGPDIILKIYNSEGRRIFKSSERSGAGRETHITIRLNPLDLIGEYTVMGKVRDARANRELCNLKVEAWDDDLFLDDRLGRDTTDRDGNYQIIFDKDDFKEFFFDHRPDPFVKVKNDAGDILAWSHTISEAPHHSTINVNIRGYEHSRSVSECVYSWTSAYRQEGTHVMVRIELNPDADISDETLANLRNTWKTGIENKWSNHFACCCEKDATDTLMSSNWAALTFEVRWVTSNPHHTVRVRTGPARSNMRTWDTADTGNVASHEFGHMLGLVDEYQAVECPDRGPVNTGTVMDDNTEVVERQVEDFCKFINENAVPIAAAPPEREVEEKPSPKEKAERDSRRMEDREKVLKKLIQAIEKEGELDKEDRILYGISGGPTSQRLESLVEVMLDGPVRHSVKDGLKGVDREYSDDLDKKTIVNLLKEIKEVGLLELEVAHEGFIPDSLIGFIRIRIGGEETSFYYLADREQRIDQGKKVPQAIVLISDRLQRVGERAVKRDKDLQKKIGKKHKKKSED